MANAMSFYTPNLTPFVHRAAAAGTPTLGVTYENPVDNLTMWSLRFLVPNTGHVVEVAYRCLRRVRSVE